MTGEGIAAIILAAGTVAGQIGTIFMQFQQRKVSRSNSDKLDDATDKINDNTALTKATALKVDDVHAATAALVESTGTHQALKSE